MKAQFFNKPLNYSLNLEGEAWEQGSLIKGELSLSNTSAKEVDLTQLGCHLCLCQNKKIKAKDSSGIKLIKSLHFEKGQESLELSFQLDSNCIITDNTTSFQLICGDISDPFNCGMIEVKVIPTQIIKNFIEVFETFYRFKFKTLKNKKGFIEAQITPPAIKDWAKIQKATLQMKIEDKDLIINCLFSTKVLSFDSAIAGTKDEKKEILLKITPKEYSLYGAVNQQGIQKHISEALDQVKLKSIR